MKKKHKREVSVKKDKMEVWDDICDGAKTLEQGEGGQGEGERDEDD